ncbi:MAG: heavy metal translocating P-type ATPase, partial [Chthonomonadaceae bacterium]|nr:heavy metal translocating P-type ATPase [Chthonomonadaceae bacterium]
PGDRIPFDGEVVEGQSTVDQAPITGESVPVEKTAGDPLYAGTINHDGVLEFRVTANLGNTTLDRIIKTVQEAQASRAPSQRFVDSFARVYTPSVVVLAVLVAGVPPVFFAEPFVPWLYRALVLLVIACPCALVISTPVTVVSGLASAARRGILIKGGVHLENGRKLKIIALDKTGTLTEGRPKVTDFQPLHDHEDDHALQIAASLDALTDHPIAKAIRERWDGALLPVEGFRSLFGKGVAGKIAGQGYFVGNHKLAEENGVCCDHVHEVLYALQVQGKTAVVLTDDVEALAVFGVSDTLRETSVEAIRGLHRLGLRTLMLTGDNEATARTIAEKAGIDDVRAELSPDEKLAHIERLQAEGGHVGMIGDGVNDAPALAKAEIGFAMGAAGTDTAQETADVALMQDDLRKVPEFILLSRRAVGILSQNLAIALGIKVVFFALALFGVATLWMAVFADMGGSLLVVGNGLRLLRSRG